MPAVRGRQLTRACSTFHLFPSYLPRPFFKKLIPIKLHVQNNQPQTYTFSASGGDIYRSARTQLTHISLRPLAQTMKSLSRKSLYSSVDDSGSDCDDDDRDDTRTLTPKFSRSPFSQLSNRISITRTKSENKSRSGTKSRRNEMKERSRSGRKSTKSDDLFSRASSNSIFHRKKRPRLNTSLPRRSQSGRSGSNANKSSLRIDQSGNWRCSECHYCPNTKFDPHCFQCGEMKLDVKFRALLSGSLSTSVQNHYCFPLKTRMRNT